MAESRTVFLIKTCRTVMPGLSSSLEKPRMTQSAAPSVERTSVWTTDRGAVDPTVGWVAGSRRLLELPLSLPMYSRAVRDVAPPVPPPPPTDECDMATIASSRRATWTCVGDGQRIQRPTNTQIGSTDGRRSCAHSASTVGRISTDAIARSDQHRHIEEIVNMVYI